MIILGLTGSIGMGKSTAAQMFRQEGVPVHDADAAVHRLMAPGGAAVEAVETAFPGVTGPDGVDRKALGAIVFDDAAALKRLEAILHPLVRETEHRFKTMQLRLGRPLVVLDIPLLFETGAEDRCDLVAVVTAPAFLQRQRVLSRPGMTQERFEQVLAKQIPDREKCLRADYLIQSGIGRYHALQQVREIVQELVGR